jgi:cobalt transporter subunit CbtA
MIVRALLGCILAGLAAGALVAMLHVVFLAPLIAEAEQYESGAATHTGHDAGHDSDHEHGVTHDPHEGPARTLYTVAADMLMATGWALLLLALFALTGKPVDWRSGLLWGVAGFIATAAIPAMNLPPELPGSDAGDLGDRQLAWIVMAAGTATGIWLIAFARRPWAKACGGVLIALAAFAVPVPPLVAPSPAPEAIRSAFVWRSLAVALVLWLALGAATGFACRRAMRIDTGPE